MTVQIENRKLLIDGRNAEPKLQAESAAVSYKDEDGHYDFIVLKDGVGQTAKVAVHADGSVKDTMAGQKALAQKVIFDEVNDLVHAAGHLRDRYHTDKNTIKLLRAARSSSSADAGMKNDITHLKEHVSMMAGLDAAFEEGLGTIETAVEALMKKGYYTDADIETLLDTYVTRYLYPLEYKLQIKGYVLNEAYSRLRDNLKKKRIKAGYFDQRRLKKHIDMMASLEMKESPWIRILDENLETPVSWNTTEDSVVSALTGHLTRQSQEISQKMIYNDI